MKILFVHQNFPGQYLHLARHLGTQPGNEVVFITQRTDATLPGVKNIVYKPHRGITQNQHHYLVDTEAGLLNAQAVARVALDLKQAGFVPDVMLGHNGWGEIWYLKDVYPNTPLIGYFEFFYRFLGADVGFDQNEPQIFDNAPRIRTKNLGNLLGLDASDIGQTPTQWQRSLYPEAYQSKLLVSHEGIDTGVVKPDPNARLNLPEFGIDLTRDNEVVTYVARNLEPYRGFPQFMRSLPSILEQRPHAHVVIIGGDEVSYGHRLPDGQTHKQLMLTELGASLDMKRVHFLGKVPYSVFLKILQISRVHVYLTFPFVLSWSMLEAMSAGCVVVGSKTAPVEEVIRDGSNGLLMDFFSPTAISERVVEVLAAGRDGYADIRQNARQTIVDEYDLKTICLPAQTSLLAQVARS
ncbi:D-inositol 3-phosphate glycosyltransferase [mine drainage metagenome]|uniref:D-inositol 3-phosphate glycosyltransferase n=1 Tax=mine drainage metagenome TaxID=410659 RepID=A0A1J5RSM2_9ZZZZ